MKYNIKIGEKIFAVEIDDINTRPVLVRVDGQEFEVSPQTDNPISAPESKTGSNEPTPAQKSELKAAPDGANLAGNVMTAPLPGTVIETFIKPGDVVEAGQVILIIEAMKMKNSIRSIRDGIVAAVHVSAGQTVAHKQALVEFKE